VNHSPAYILANYLIGEGLLQDPSESGGWPVYVGQLPDGPEAPDDAAVSIDTTPVKDGRVMGGAALFHYGVQLLLRSEGYNEGYAKAVDVAGALDGVDDDLVVLGANTYKLVNVSQATGVVALGQEKGTKRRWMFSMNFLATLQEE